MPHIKEIRLVNVHFNNATQFYDDFRMKLEGKNATYDLENGGGKSLLLLMLLQTVLPKSYLRKEKPVSLLFQGGKDRTSHVAVEWILEEGSDYKYLLTGFSARKRRGTVSGGAAVEDDENVTAGDIEHINWCVFYNDKKITGIKSVPMCSGESGKKTYAGFDDIRKFIQQVRQKGLPAEVFEGIDRYQSFISGQQLIPAEWNIIKGINSGENSIEAYFRQNPTSRKLIENQFVKIIEDVEALNKGEKNNEESLLLADTLIEIRKRLSEYLKLKGHMTEFEKIKEYYTEFGTRNNELLESFLRFEEYKHQAAAVRNLIGQKLQQLKSSESETLKKTEENKAGVAEGNTLLKLLQAGLVTFEITGLKKDRDRLESEYSTLQEEHKEQKEKYFGVMALEEYGEYRKAKSRMLEAHKSLSLLLTDKDKANLEYGETAGKLKYLLNQNLVRFHATEAGLKTTLDGNVIERKLKNDELMELIGKEAGLEAEIKPLVNIDIELRGLLDILNKYFIKNGDMDALLEPQKLIEATEKHKFEHEEQQAAVVQRINDIGTRLQVLDVNIEKIKGEIRLSEQAKAVHDQWLMKYQEEFESLRQRTLGFNKNSLEEYSEELEVQIEREALKKLEYEIEIGRLKQKKQLSEKRGYYVPNEELITFSEALSTKCEYVKLGIDWIAESGSVEKKEAILDELPFLPFSVIVDGKSFERLKNGRIKTEFSSDYPIPLVNLETLRGLKDPAKGDIFYVCSFSELLISDNKFIQYMQGIEDRLVVLDKEAEVADTRIVSLREDLNTLLLFMREHKKQVVEENIKKAERLAGDIAENNKKLTSVGKEKTQLINEKTQTGEMLSQLLVLISKAAEKLEKLRNLIKHQQEQNQIRKELSEKKEAQEAVQKAKARITNEIAALDAKTQQLQEELQGLRLQLHDLEMEGKAVESFAELANVQQLEEVRSDFNSLQAAMGGQLADENRLRRDIKDYQERLSNSGDRIKRDYQRDLEGIWESEQNGIAVIIPTKDIILKAKSEKESIETMLRKLQKDIGDLTARISNAEGKKGEILKGISANETKELTVYDSEEKYQDEIRFTVELIESYSKEIIILEGELKKLNSESIKMSSQADYYDSFIRRTGVTTDSAAIASELKDFRTFEEEYVLLERAINRQCEKWSERITSIRQETTAFVITEPLEELSKISRPDTAAQCRERQQAFREYVSNIDQQMQKISSDILQLESYQQDFTRRCIQRAELVLGHLRKMETLSKIEVNGRRVNMIEVKMNDFEDKEKQLRMKNHIEGIVREISEDGAVDRKRVALKLSTKELLAQIVDMDKAVVRLYKIESIPENSRFYRWEYAVGSEGQNNSLYFIFAACLISFIRMLSITNTSLKTKKVIIADNPFGATSAVYLWEPMFQIMKQNHIQLIAPGHRIPREITSRFGVSYLLNQDILQDGRMRVVVKDVRVEEDEEVMQYMNPEQLTLI
ncbi:hypothetical protein [Ruminiclostridium cellobioparum]|uniref:hypothetical protein n=1 Tax=Ruminiclostridium cellobioparum TaxID=29355 RepID=UPI00047FCC4E|nr:hypothetical protein [Ruminiclostridium cellobioparum]